MKNKISNHKWVQYFLVVALICLSPKVFSAGIILTSDKQLNDLLNPDTKIDVSVGLTQEYASLREICEQGKKRGDKVLTIAFDEFFRQYRKEAGAERLYTPDMDEYIDKIKIISDFAAKYGMGIDLSLLSPLELGKAFQKSTGQSGQWLHYKVANRDPQTGKFNVQFWKQLFWTNNKGRFAVKLKGFKAYAFKEKTLQDSPYKMVNPSDIIEIKDGVQLDEYDSSKTNDGVQTKETSRNAELVNVSSSGDNQAKGCDRVLVLLEYETQEMDYFSPEALPFLKNLLKKYHDKGVNLVSLYSDEMHIQQDWFYFDHHDNGQFCVRYYTPSMGKVYSEKFGQSFDEKQLLYFDYGMQSNSNLASAPVNMQYIFGNTPEDVQRTMLMRHRYYKLLNNQVVDLFLQAKKYAEELFGREFRTSAHSSWAESPTIDLWNTEKLHTNAYRYEYTSNFLWSNTVQQASAACYDYFKWGEYLQPTGNDFAECGWLDRNYYGAAMATSIGVINKYPNAYAAYWGMPEPSRVRKEATNNAFGAQASRSIDLMTGHVHRDVDVLILYPMNVVAAEPRFGSWMTQYAYANYITSDKLLEMGKILPDGRIQIAGKTYSTLVTLYEPLPASGLLDFMHKFATSGGKLVWFGVPALIDENSEKCSSQWSDLFKVNYSYSVYQGEIAAGKIVNFKNQFEKVPSQTILTDFLVDRIYPVVPLGGTETVAETDGKIIGVSSRIGKGSAFYFGFRPRDDQSASLGYETRTLFEILNAVGAYPSTGKFANTNDNTEYVSRNSDYFTTRFPNGTTIVVRHYRTHRENWEGGFSRDEVKDNLRLKENPMPSDEVRLENFKVNGHTVNYSGKLTVAFRLNNQELVAFDGYQCKEINIDGENYTFTENPFSRIVFVPENESGSSYALYLQGEGKIRIPVSGLTTGRSKLLDSNNKKLKFQIEKDWLTFNVTSDLSGKWLRIIK
ncbi:MAG: hypothetical protein A2W90_23925 [Bacteroidetes bacterium GWF2_42_66]|nr:MAG: hypothetical protein A2W92_16345 [Bacteroidetes bacterium GWA2_42_15]OFY00270.1 MAG: hypothetical protein A2W89_13740 [Bacteroidetes bacterium GWE2_42_39]OFY47159.1 MAG: hypothetical protein A2W90_23925 [Bacteroidetes bacterium GWF2_42_66]HBL76651.1 hypothetical protein [Prolixibacteraceae bacterium]HCR89818.1 hypothetical protein [Prolixibacteraceae bacterium]